MPTRSVSRLVVGLGALLLLQGCARVPATSPGSILRFENGISITVPAASTVRYDFFEADPEATGGVIESVDILGVGGRYDVTIRSFAPGARWGGAAFTEVASARDRSIVVLRPSENATSSIPVVIELDIPEHAPGRVIVMARGRPIETSRGLEVANDVWSALKVEGPALPRD